MEPGVVFMRGVYERRQGLKALPYGPARVANEWLGRSDVGQGPEALPNSANASLL
jgi:hypothetical protein